ncbi:MAG TPA: bile acid:sodium symporter [Pirellulales bacterium]|jgi:BASS family bile acid:Na+ symporter
MLATFSQLVHKRFLWLLIASYIVAGFFPGWGLAIRGISWGSVSLPMLMLGFLLFNAGSGINVAELTKLRHDPWCLIAGLAANLLIPVVFIWLVMQTMRAWHNGDEVQNILVGLALVASMPIAGSSTAWSQNANGNLALSLGLVLMSTLISPLCTPIALHSVGLMTTGDYSEDLHEMAESGTGWFLLVSVVVPSLLGVLCNRAVARRVSQLKPYLKLANSTDLLLLNYSNAAVSLPQAVADPDPDFLIAILTITLLLCLVGFATGWMIAKARRTGPPEQVSLMFGLGMNNNGTGLVLASMTLADHPRVLLPIIFYNLVQHLIAGCVDFVMLRRSSNGAGRADLQPHSRHREIAQPARHSK